MLPAANILPPNSKGFPEVKFGEGFNLGQFFEVFVVSNPLFQLHKLCSVAFNHPSNSMKTDCTVVTGVDLRMRNYPTSILLLLVVYCSVYIYFKLYGS